MGLEVKAALYGKDNRPYVAEFVAGLGGRDLTVETFIEVLEKAGRYAQKQKDFQYELIGGCEK